MSFSGKKWQLVKADNMTELLDVLKLDDRLKSLLKQTNVTSSYTKNADDTWTYKVEAGGEAILQETFTLEKEHDFTRSDGAIVKTIFTLEGDTLKQVLKRPEGRNLYFERIFSGNTMKMKVTADSIDITGFVEYQTV